MIRFNVEFFDMLVNVNKKHDTQFIGQYSLIFEVWSSEEIVLIWKLQFSAENNWLCSKKCKIFCWYRPVGRSLCCGYGTDQALAELAQSWIWSGPVPESSSGTLMGPRCGVWPVLARTSGSVQRYCSFHNKFVLCFLAIFLLLLLISKWNLHDMRQRFLCTQKRNFSWIW